MPPPGGAPWGGPRDAAPRSRPPTAGSVPAAERERVHPQHAVIRAGVQPPAGAPRRPRPARRTAAADAPRSGGARAERRPPAIIQHIVHPPSPAPPTSIRRTPPRPARPSPTSDPPAHAPQIVGEAPEPITSTPSRRSGASARPAQMVPRALPGLHRQLHYRNVGAGYISSSGTQAPWSRPRTWSTSQPSPAASQQRRDARRRPRPSRAQDSAAHTAPAESRRNRGSSRLRRRRSPPDARSPNAPRR